jgi:hypothetical protein
LSALGRLLETKEIADIHPRFWQRLLESINPMLSYDWSSSEKIILNHQKEQNKFGLMDSLLLILANCDGNTKVIVLEFVKNQI